MRSASDGSPAASATISVSRLTTASCLSRSRAPAFVRTWTRTYMLSPSTFDKLEDAHVVDERRRVLAEHRDVWDLLDRHEFGREGLRQSMRIAEGSGRGIHIDHGHGLAPFELSPATRRYPPLTQSTTRRPYSSRRLLPREVARVERMDLAVREKVVEVLVVRPRHEVIIAPRDDLGRRGDRRQQIAQHRVLFGVMPHEASGLREAPEVVGADIVLVDFGLAVA